MSGSLEEVSRDLSTYLDIEEACSKNYEVPTDLFDNLQEIVASINSKQNKAAINKEENPRGMEGFSNVPMCG